MHCNAWSHPENHLVPIFVILPPCWIYPTLLLLFFLCLPQTYIFWAELLITFPHPPGKLKKMGENPPPPNLSRLHFPNTQLLDPPTHAAPLDSDLTNSKGCCREVDAQARSRKATCRWPQLHRIKDCKKREENISGTISVNLGAHILLPLSICCRFNVFWSEK